MKLIIISGLSGAGKSVALATIEDLGFYCVDNLPVALLDHMVDQMLHDGEANSHYRRTAVGIDARNAISDLAKLPKIIQQIKQRGLDCELFFLQAAQGELLKRFSETRRKHPLSTTDLALVDAIDKETRLLEPISEAADLSIDTTHTNQHQLRDIIRKRLHTAGTAQLSVMFQSFGFKHGVPTDVDYVFDVRCLPNPHWEPHLRPLTGRDKPVRDFLESDQSVHTMFSHIRDFLTHWIPELEASNRTYLTVAVGCTGGQHRSVYLTERLTEHFSSKRAGVISRHRELS